MFERGGDAGDATIVRPGTPQERLLAARRVLERAEATTRGVADEDRFLPIPDALASVVPFGGLRRGSAAQVVGSTALLLALTGSACRDGGWCAFVGLPDLGLAAAAEAGLRLDRMVVVPRVGVDAPAVLGAAVDGFDVVVVGNVPHLVERDRRLLSSRLRSRGAVLLSTAPWPGAELVISVTTSRWVGIGEGVGSLCGRELVVQIRGRGAAAGNPAQVRLRSPDGVLLAPATTSTGPVETLPGLERRAG